VHDNARSEAHHLPETCGGGGVIFDYDKMTADGYISGQQRPVGLLHPKTAIRGALYHNNTNGTFTDVTGKGRRSRRHLWHGRVGRGLRRRRWIDLYVNGYGRNILYHNMATETFTDVTDKSGLDVKGWSTHATWFDYDNDGKLDLFVSSFVEYTPTVFPAATID